MARTTTASTTRTRTSRAAGPSRSRSGSGQAARSCGRSTLPRHAAWSRRSRRVASRRSPVCLLWSIANPVHELALGALIEELMPGVPYTLSHQLMPILREYRRASATAIDASLTPLIQ